jgi:hypothetical protein
MDIKEKAMERVMQFLNTEKAGESLKALAEEIKNLEGSKEDKTEQLAKYLRFYIKTRNPNDYEVRSLIFDLCAISYNVIDFKKIASDYIDKYNINCGQ